ncbi:hypothetical protein [Spirosoma endophyticum]|uniref:Uncharacterized protein n=1 Tax=Spirosoma endophyticum TaxID=662367 RepID=A0A1I1PP44_9BACT|nr:hypothetical protein [Spirosoma endophyticum]SFD11546.1 hypothetical protein SAMN05216167_103370 [Spirosoma endophyticum]
MRFIAVFNQLQTTTSFGFDNLSDAVDFLCWGYEDQELIPQGVYDALTDQATPYLHAGRRIGDFSTAAIRTIATNYLTSIRQWLGFPGPSDG